MGNIGLPPIKGDASSSGMFLTFVASTREGCNLKCPFCMIKQRREIGEDILQPEDFFRFIREAHAREPLYAVAMQGYEPLLPGSRPYTQAVLAAGLFLGVPPASSPTASCWITPPHG
jgi:sulfatase maturation enzyme AslB (radical SAM superfamily)